jgi:hypothetical protein
MFHADGPVCTATPIDGKVLAAAERWIAILTTSTRNGQKPHEPLQVREATVVTLSGFNMDQVCFHANLRLHMIHDFGGREKLYCYDSKPHC